MCSKVQRKDIECENDFDNAKIVGLLNYVQITNPNITLDKLKNELAKSEYVSLSLLNTFEQYKRE